MKMIVKALNPSLRSRPPVFFLLAPCPFGKKMDSSTASQVASFACLAFVLATTHLTLRSPGRSTLLSTLSRTYSQSSLAGSSPPSKVVSLMKQVLSNGSLTTGIKWSLWLRLVSQVTANPLSAAQTDLLLPTSRLSRPWWAPTLTLIPLASSLQASLNSSRLSNRLPLTTTNGCWEWRVSLSSISLRDPSAPCDWGNIIDSALQTKWIKATLTS